MPHPPIYPAQCHLVAVLAASRCGLGLIFIIAPQQIPFTISQMAAQGHLSVPAPFVTADPPFSSIQCFSILNTSFSIPASVFGKMRS